MKRFKLFRRGSDGRTDERGATMIMAATLIVVFLGAAAIAIDVGQLYYAKSQLQTAADSAAVAAAHLLPTEAAVDAKAVEYANANDLGHGPTTSGSDVDTGHWDTASRTFTAGGSPTNAVRVVTNRTTAYGNPVDNVFADVLGIDTSDVTATAIAISRKSVLDFEGIAPGAQPASISSGNGISGDPVPGVVGITTKSPKGFGPMIFDSDCDGRRSRCTGGDPDLYAPGQGNSLIISEDGDSSDPDDDGACPNGRPSPPAHVSVPSDVTTVCSIVFDFRGFGTGLVRVGEVTLIDVENDAFVWLYRDSNLVGQITLRDAADGETVKHAFPGAPEADIMVVSINSSGAVDDIGYTESVDLVG